MPIIGTVQFNRLSVIKYLSNHFVEEIQENHKLRSDLIERLGEFLHIYATLYPNIAMYMLTDLHAQEHKTLGRCRSTEY